MISRHRRIRASVRTRRCTKARDEAELAVARLIARRLLQELSAQLMRAMAVDLKVNRRVRNSKFTTALIWAVTYLDTVEEDDLPGTADESSTVADAILHYMEQQTCAYQS